jgi:hypothetical protein
MAITKDRAARRIREIMSLADAELSKLAEQVRTERVIPVCRRHGWTFSSGMGTYAFFRKGQAYSIDDRLLGTLADTLDLEVYDGQPLGTWVRNVNPDD